MCRKFFPAIVVIIAVLMAIAASLAKPDSVDTVVMVSRFFDIMLPILAVGGLIKYLCCSHSHKTCHCGCENCKLCSKK
ncbi:hypothetical protein [Rickettsiella grylli]|uniref:Uncharacterized protein n=1 Tax=Rickettsiella grylli TaxID=59196 RepID=A8PMQ0_9COXI|nr:hypothetical protein [Rickettsiella grylli]EDP46383.1 hypothetical protein RICGR_0795 [Rickettsiella grylli]OIZ99694.1 hypothetical protein BEV13_05220 [Rickettsiella grylli]